MPDKSQRTEKPTPRRIEKARGDGQFASSRELASAVQFLVFVAIVARWGGAWLAAARRTTHVLIERAFRTDVSAAELMRLSRDALWESMLPLVIVAAVLVATSLATQLAMTRLGFSLKKLAPDFKRLNPLSRVPEMARQNLWALAKALVMLPLFGAVVWAIASDNLESYLAMPLTSVEAGARRLADSLLGLLWRAAGAFVVLGLVDMLRAHRRYVADLRMSKQEMRDEARDLEGNPQVKARIRRLQRDLRRRQMMKEVQTATAVVVNPTHYAVAIRYRMEIMAAPVVVAKGKNYMARRIREIAAEHQVPLIENPPLAQALYGTVKVGQPIPIHLYRAVAEILAYIYRLKNGRLPG
jgi:flagellar biosynthetic protein FlhB